MRHTYLVKVLHREFMSLLCHFCRVQSSVRFTFSSRHVLEKIKVLENHANVCAVFAGADLAEDASAAE